ncbi:MAG: TonB-dependent receptor [Bacteroidaceae bacterium]|nr:TonB-dependent receptor [Bacteroidaceae bacterium]
MKHLLLTGLLSLLVLPSAADKKDTANVILNEIVVTGLTGKTRLAESPLPFTVVTPQALQFTPKTNLIDAISHQPGLAQITTGTGISKPVIRGLGYNRVVVVAEGIRQEGQQWGDEHGLEVDGEGVWSAEVLKGPASLMYGSDAMAGVLVMHPAPVLPEDEMEARATTEYQSNQGLMGYTLNFAGNRGGVVWDGRFTDRYAHAYRNSRDGRVPGSQYRERDLSALFGMNRRWGHSHLRFSWFHATPGIVEGERDAATGGLEWPDGVSQKTYRLTLPFQHVDHKKLVADQLFWLPKGSLKAILGYQRNGRKEFEEARDEADLWLLLHTLNYDVRYQLEDLHGWQLSTGIGGMYQHSLNRGEEYLIPDYDLFDFGLYGTATHRWGRWNLTGGVRGDVRRMHASELLDEGALRFQNLDRTFSGFTASLGAVYNPADDWNVRLNVSRGFRAPNVSELCSNGVHEGSIRYEVGNGDLRSEYSWQTDLGMDWTSRYVALQASLFANLIDNYIFLGRMGNVVTDGYRTYQYRQGDALLWGGEVSLDVHPWRSLHVQNGFGYVRGMRRHAAACKDLPLIPAPRWNCDVRYAFRRPFQVALGMEYDFRQNHFFSEDDTETRTPGYFLLSASVGYELRVRHRRVATFQLSGTNLLDKAYQSHLSRLKYADVNPVTGRMGVCNMGRNICLKAVFYWNHVK